MTAFGTYSEHYDLLYYDKDYAAEARFVAEILARHGVAAGRLLDLGCGTGRHALAMAELGFWVDGVDLSEQMLAMAESRRANADPAVAARLSFKPGDARKYDAGRRYDAVMALFHVLCYQVTDQDVRAALATVRRHLAPGAPFLFDVWHGPAVLADPPRRREKSAENERWRLHRMSDPVWQRDQDSVQVIYTITATDKVSGATSTVTERHDVRYMFLPWLKDQLTLAGFKAIEEGEWLTGAPVEDQTFGIYLVARAT